MQITKIFDASILIEPYKYWEKLEKNHKKKRNFGLHRTTERDIDNLKVRKSQKDFFLKLRCPKKEQNILQTSALASKGRFFSNISFNGVSKKMFLRFTDLYCDMPLDLKT